VAPLPPGTPPSDRAAGWDKGHGRIEWRQLEATPALTGYLTWPGAAQVCRIERRRRIRGEESVEVVHAITSLSPERADAARLLELSRAHWGIENRLHWVRDVTLGEDACRVRTGAAPQVLAACRNAVLTLVRRLGLRVVEGIEHFQEHRRAALNLVRFGRIE
jgi:predicted transposase YbfD/YdcC